MQRQLSDLMNTELVSLDEAEPASAAARWMRDAGVGSVLVTSGGRLAGILTDRDIVTRCIAEEADPTRVPVGSLCTDDVVALGPEALEGDAIRLMIDRAVRRVPIVSGERVVGIVTLGDLAVARDADSALGRISAAPPSPGN